MPERNHHEGYDLFEPRALESRFIVSKIRICLLCKFRDKTHVQSNLRKAYFGSQLEYTGQHAGEVKAAGAETASHMVSTVRKKVEMKAIVQLALSSFTLRHPAHGMTLSTFRVGVPISINLILIILPRHAQRFVSMVI